MDPDSASEPLLQDDATNIHAEFDLIHDTSLAPQQIQEATDSSEAWASQTYQVYEYIFDDSKDQHGIVQSFSTKSTFNSTVGESRLRMGIRNDAVKMTNGRENNYFKATKWSPDGSCLLSSSNDNCLRITALPDLAANPDDTQLETGVLIREGEVVYDMCWYPQMSSQDPATCCVLSSSRDHPVHLWDAFTGELRCSYTIVDHCEVNVAPNALCFNLDGSKIYCGSNNMVQIFDTSRPGKDSEKHPTVPTRKSKKGQKGVISCLAFNPDHSDLYAAGSYLRTIGLYDARANELLMLLRDKNHRPKRMTSDHGQPTANIHQSTSSPMGGLTDLKFSPDGLYLYSASRMDSYIRCWDIRNTADVLYRLERPGEQTNQRIGFDISCDGRLLSTGDMNGDVSFFDLTSPSDSEAARLSARFHAHDDVVSTSAFHPSGTILVTSSGQRKYELALDSDPESDSDSSDSESDRLADTTSSKVIEALPSAGTIDNSIRLWSMPGAFAWYVNGQRWSETDVATGNQPSTEVYSEGASSMDVVVESTESLHANVSSIDPALAPPSFTDHSG